MSQQWRIKQYDFMTILDSRVILGSFIMLISTNTVKNIYSHTQVMTSTNHEPHISLIKPWSMGSERVSEKG